MKINKSWLDEWVSTGLDTESIGQRLTMAGLELDSTEPAAPDFSGVVVAHIIGITQHPDADKLRICRVSTGKEELQVICGAANARQDLRVALATVGAVLPGGMEIKRARLRGVESFGMLCSDSELGLAEQSEGILELPTDAPIGTDIREYLDLNDDVMDIDLTPNRADCLSVLGVARELAVLSGADLQEVDIHEHAPEINDQINVSVEADAACPRYIGRMIRGINMSAETPLWMIERLRRCGIRSLNPIVDVTNFVMLELGQPMHAFDADLIEGGITVRMAQPGEQLTLLDEKVITLDADTLVIADDRKPLAMAGVMGGLESAINESTKDIVLESAFFQPEVIAGKARAFGLHTDSSHRFERGVDFELQCKAIARASELIQSIAGGKTGAIVEKVSAENLPDLAMIKFRPSQIKRRLGVSIDSERSKQILTALGCLVDVKEQDSWCVVPPSYRFDLQLEVDLIEELARVFGYDNIEPHQRSWTPVVTRVPEGERIDPVIKDLLINQSYQEVITYSFVDALTDKLLSPDTEPFALSNPISSDLAVMRTSLWGGLLKTLQHNVRRQQSDVRIFETGLVFRQVGDMLKQEKKIAGLVSGHCHANDWSVKTRKMDYYDIKGDVESLLDNTVDETRIVWQQGSHPALHPGQSASLLLDGEMVGQVGLLHPGLQEKFDLSQEAYLFELDSSLLNRVKVPAFKPLSKFPSLRRDLAILVDESVTSKQILQSLESLGNKMITASHIFDVYQGEGIASGLKSVALGLILQDFSRTLEEHDVDHVVTRVVEQLNQDVGARLRD